MTGGRCGLAPHGHRRNDDGRSIRACRGEARWRRPRRARESGTACVCRSQFAVSHAPRRSTASPISAMPPLAAVLGIPCRSPKYAFSECVNELLPHLTATVGAAQKCATAAASPEVCRFVRNKSTASPFSRCRRSRRCSAQWGRTAEEATFCRSCGTTSRRCLAYTYRIDDLSDPGRRLSEMRDMTCQKCEKRRAVVVCTDTSLDVRDFAVEHGKDVMPSKSPSRGVSCHPRRSCAGHLGARVAQGLARRSRFARECGWVWSDDAYGLA